MAYKTSVGRIAVPVSQFNTTLRRPAPRFRRVASLMEPDCCTDCKCPNNCAGCPDYNTSNIGGRKALSGTDDITKTSKMRRYSQRPARYGALSGLGGDDDEVFKMCVAGGGSPGSCADGKDVSAAVYGAALNQTSTPAFPGSSSSSSSGTAGAIAGGIGSVLGSLFGAKPAAPGYRVPVSSGMSTTTKIALAGGAALALVLIAKR